MVCSLSGGRVSALLLDKNGLGAGNVAARNAQRSGVRNLLRGFLHPQTKVSALELFDLGLQAGNVFFAQFSRFHFSKFS